MIISDIVLKSHELLLSSKNKNTAVDATCGNGYDTLFLLNNFKQVYAFDIQPLAIKRTKEKTIDFTNLNLIQDSFQNIDKYITNIDAIIFNLGFLPGSNRKITTDQSDSPNAIIKTLKLLNKDGIMIICCYTKHENGMNEYNDIINILNKNNIKYTIYDEFQNEEKIVEIKINN